MIKEGVATQVPYIYIYIHTHTHTRTDYETMGPWTCKRAPLPLLEKKIVRSQNTHAHTPLGVYIYFTINALDFTVELYTLAIVLGK